jgi:GNAT superfamily N-acetyltransferase
MPESVRLLHAADLDSAMRLKAAANWNQTPEDWLRFLKLEPEGCFGFDVDGMLVSSAGAIRYGTRLSWIGMVLTLPEFRGRGYAARLMGACIDFLESRDVEWIKLDATAQGRPIYARLGFEDECPIERWYRSPAPVETAAVDPFEFDAELDSRAFGANRMRLLERLAPIGAVSITGEGYAMARPGSEAHYFGPCVSRSPEAALRMMSWAIAQAGNRPICCDLLPDNNQAIRVAKQLGFERRRELVRMVRRGARSSAPIEAENALVYAIAGFEYG